MNEKISIVKRYYQSWANQDKKKALDCLSSDTFTFSSPQDSVSDAKHFITTCWNYSQGLREVFRFI
ncbi:MAG: hypothetical protein KAR20_01775 [Candidatus Heimdallarchaeota archaeon]|nr:hypothetical protein [Candidatus Heimdallarchaeota archaeon]